MKPHHLHPSIVPFLFLAIAASCWSHTPAAAQSKANNKVHGERTSTERAATERASTAPTSTERTWLPFELYQKKYIYIRGKVQGHSTDMVLDTGAGKTVIDKTFAKKIKLKTQGSVTAAGVGGSVPASWATGVDLELGKARVDDLTAVVIDMGFVARILGRGMPVILGVDIFNDMVVDIDYPNRRVAFLPRKGFVYAGKGDTLPVKQIPGTRMWKVQARVNGVKGWFHMDTGSGGTIDLAADFAGEHRFLANADRKSRWLNAGVGGFIGEQILSAKTIQIGMTTLSDVPMSVQEKAQARGTGHNGRLGVQVLGRFRLICDFPRQRIHIEPGPACKTRPFRRDRLGIYPDLTTERLQAKMIAPGSPAAAAGWKAGMVITAVEGTSGSPRELLKKIQMSNANGKKIRLRDGKGKEHSIVLSRYY